MDIIAYNIHSDLKDLFTIERADYKRDWMDAYNYGFAYRCLPLKIANEAGWVVKSPIDFELKYVTDDNYSDSVEINISENDKKYRSYITSHFGRGVVTFSLPFLFRTPKPWCIWARGYPNYYKKNVSFLEGIVETYWLHSTFTYNIRLIEKDEIVEFKKGDPIFFLTMININKVNHSVIKNMPLENNKLLKDAYNQWTNSRDSFIKNNTNPLEWQKDYFKGIKPDSTIVNEHITTIKLNTTEEQE